MQLTQKRAPYLRDSSSQAGSWDFAIAMFPLFVMAFYYYGPRPLLVALFSAAAAYVAGILCTWMCGRKPSFSDVSDANCALLISLMLPASVPYYLPALGAIFAIVVVKNTLGGNSNNPFNLTAVGFCFITLAFPQLIGQYTLPLEKLPLFGEITAKMAESPAYILKLGGVPHFDLMEMALGNYPGPMGATNILVLLTCLLYLVLRRCVRWYMPVTFMGVAAAIAFLFPRISTGRLDSVLFELLSGTLLFGAVFLVSSPFTAPKTRLAQVIYAACCAMLTMGFRYFGAFELGLCPALLLMNAFSHTLDREIYRLRMFLKGRGRKG